MSDGEWDDSPSTFDFNRAFENKDSGSSHGGGRGGGRGRGNFRGRRGGGLNNEERGVTIDGSRNNDDSSRSFSYSRRGGRGCGARGGGFNSRYDDDNEQGRRTHGGGGGGDDDREFRRGRNEGEERPKPVTYVPPEDEDENSLFVSGISSGINFSKYDSIDIKVTGENAPKCIKTFETCGLKDILLKNIVRSGYVVPTPVQKNSIPIISDKRDLMACAQTGSGKTAAFLIPIINNLLIESPTNLATRDSCVEPNCVILSPTRELCIQIFDEARKFAHGSILKVAKLYGGVQVSYQAQKLLSGCHILVSTPGRLLDFVNRGKVRFSAVKYFVLDEADRMLDLGFLPDVKKMLQHPSMVASGDRVTLMFSATFPREIQQLAGDYLCSNYLFLVVGIVGGACSDVVQEFYAVSKFDKREKLIEILEDRENQNELTLVFVETKRNADFLAVYLCENNFRTTSIHGDRLQNQREEALRDFKRGTMPILVATAVAARGLDIRNVAHVINYDLPSSIDEYVHRIGRTGRVGNSGKATSFFDSKQDKPLAKGLVKILEQTEQNVPDFLRSEVEDFSYNEFDSFGGTDIRGDNGSKYYTHTNGPEQLEEEEDWG